MCDWQTLLSALRDHPTGLLLLDRQLWRDASSRRLLPVPGANAGMRILVFCDAVEISVVAEAIAYGVSGCLPAASTPSQWINAIDVVLREDVAMPRKLLAQALKKAQRLRADDAEPVSVAVPDAVVQTESLTERERDVIRCVTGGMTNKEIGRHLGISHATVKTHLHHVFGKLKVGRRVLLLAGHPSAVQ